MFVLWLKRCGRGILYVARSGKFISCKYQQPEIKDEISLALFFSFLFLGFPSPFPYLLVRVRSLPVSSATPH
jgi:hypothetical protein